MKTRTLNATLAAVAVALFALAGIQSARAYWLDWTSQHVVSNFQLTGGSTMQGYVEYRFNTVGLQAQVFGSDTATAYLAEIYVYASATDKCSAGAGWTTWAYAEDLKYNSIYAATDATTEGIGNYSNCTTYHAYRWYQETWGVDPAPNWQWTTGSWIS